MAQSFPVGQAPWEVQSAAKPQSFAVGQAPWEIAQAKTPTPTPQPSLASKIWSSLAIPAQTGDTAITAPLKTVANIPSSAGRFATDIAAHTFNPVEMGKKVGETLTTFYDAAREGVTPGGFAKELLPAAYHTLVPQFFQQLFSGDTVGAQKTIENDPVGQLAPVLLIGRGFAEKAGFGKQFDAVIETAAKPVTVPVEAMKGKVTAPFGKSFQPEIAQNFKNEGITPPVSAVTSSPFVQGAESLASKSAFGRKIVETYQAAKSALEQKINQVVERVSPQKTLSDENLGKTIQEGLKDYEDNFKVTENKIYEEFGKEYGNAKVDPLGVKTVLADIVQQQGKDFYQGIDRPLQSMLDRLTGETPQIKQMRAQGLSEKIIESQRQIPTLTFDELKSTRTSVGETLARTDDPALKRLYGALSEDMDRAVNRRDPTAGEQLHRLTVDYKTGKQKIESAIAQSIEKSNPERIAQNLIKRNSADTIATVKEMIGQERFREVSKAWMRSLFEGATTRGQFDVTKLKNNIRKYDMDTLGEVFDGGQRVALQDAIAELDHLQTLKDALKPGEKFAGGSQTQFLRNITGTGARVGALATALFTGQWQAAAAILAETGMEFMGTKLFTSNIGRKLLTEGFGGKTGGATTPEYLKSPVVPIAAATGKTQRKE